MAGDIYDDLLAQNYGGEEPTQSPRALPRLQGIQSYMKDQGPWIRRGLEGNVPGGKSIADFLASALQYAPMALPASRTGATIGRDNVLAGKYHRQALEAERPGGKQYFGTGDITGGHPRGAIRGILERSREWENYAPSAESSEGLMARFPDAVKYSSSYLPVRHPDYTYQGHHWMNDPLPPGKFGDTTRTSGGAENWRGHGAKPDKPNFERKSDPFADVGMGLDRSPSFTGPTGRNQSRQFSGKAPEDVFKAIQSDPQLTQAQRNYLTAMAAQRFGVEPPSISATGARPSSVPGRENVTNFPGSAFEYADGGEVVDVAEQGSVMGKQPSWQSPFAFLGSGAGRALPSVNDQSRGANASVGNAPWLDLALGMAMGPKAPRPTAGTMPRTPRQTALEQGKEALYAEGPTRTAANVQEFVSPSGVNDPSSLAGARQREVWPEMNKVRKRAEKDFERGAKDSPAMLRYQRLMDIYYGKPGSQGPQRTDDPFYRAILEFQKARPGDGRMHAFGGPVF